MLLLKLASQRSQWTPRKRHAEAALEGPDQAALEGPSEAWPTKTDSGGTIDTLCVTEMKYVYIRCCVSNVY
jgi:hypothetical protein